MKKIIASLLALAALIAVISLSKYTLIESAQLVIGSVFFIFVPAYALTSFIPDMEPLAKIVTGILFTLALFPIISFWLSFINKQITPILYAVIIIILCIAAYWKNQHALRTREISETARDKF